MKTISDITGKSYEAEDCVFFRNILQSAKYMSWGATLIDLFTDSEDKLVFVFYLQIVKINWFLFS